MDFLPADAVDVLAVQTMFCALQLPVCCSLCLLSLSVLSVNRCMCITCAAVL